MAFLWTGSQIPLYLFGGIPPVIIAALGGADRWNWFVTGYLLALAAVCPFVGAISDLIGRRYIAIIGTLLIILGQIVCSTAHTMNTFIAGMTITGAGAGINELTSLAATSEMAPTAKRGTYIALLIFTLLPFCPSVVWSQLIAAHGSWRWVGLVCGVWNFIGLLFVVFFYFPPPRTNSSGLTNRQIIAQIDFVGGFLSIGGIILFIAALLWGGSQYPWHSAHVLAPLIIGVVFMIAFVFWEIYGTDHPMFPARLRKDPRILALTLIITFISGGNFFAVLLFWPTQSYNVYGQDPIQVGLRSLPIGFGILIGAGVVLWLLSYFRGGNKPLMIVSAVMMTAGTGAMAAAREDNLAAVYVIISIACLGVGGIVIPSSIIVTIICPDDLIATIAALTLAIRVIGGAIAYTAYYNVLRNKLVPKLTYALTIAAVEHGIYDPNIIVDIGELTAASLVNEILYLPGVDGNRTIWNALVVAGQHAYAESCEFLCLINSLLFRLPFFVSSFR